MSSEQLVKELHAQFEALKKRAPFNSTFEELDHAFLITDGILAAGFVSPFLSRQLCSRISEIFMNWNNYLHGLVMPDPHYLIQMNESKFLDADEKKRALGLITRSMSFVSRNALLHARPDESLETQFIDEARHFWYERYQPELVRFVEKIHGRWKG